MQTSFEDFDPTSVDRGGMPAPGKCQLLVTEVDERDGYVSVVHQILAHEVEGQAGKTNYNNISVSGKAARRAYLFGYATGIITKEEVASATAQGTSMDIPYKAAEGCVYYATLEESEYNGKKKVRVEWDFKHLDDPTAYDYPFDPEFTPARTQAPPPPPAPKAAPKSNKPDPSAAIAKAKAAATAKAKAAATARKAKDSPPVNEEGVPF